MEVDRRELCEFLVGVFRPVRSLREAARCLDMDAKSLKHIEQIIIRKVADRMMEDQCRP